MVKKNKSNLLKPVIIFVIGMALIIILEYSKIEMHEMLVKILPLIFCHLLLEDYLFNILKNNININEEVLVIVPPIIFNLLLDERLESIFRTIGNTKVTILLGCFICFKLLK